MPYYTYQHGNPVPCTVLNNQPPSAEMTVAIVGVPRGGTTMVAAVAHALGLDLGPAAELAGFTFEDQTMNRSQMGLQLSYIAKRNQECKVWGWKDPSAIQTVQNLFFALRNPRVIVVFRDMLATIQGEMRFNTAQHINPRPKFSDLANATINWWSGNIQFITRTAFPVLLVSYERALHAPDVFLRQLTGFLGIVPTPEQMQEALARINLGGGYLRVDEQAHPIPISEPLPAELPTEPGVGTIMNKVYVEQERPAENVAP